MKRKSLIITISIVLVVVAALGIGGTIVVKKYILNTDSTTTETVVKKKGVPLELGEFTVNLQGGAFLKADVTLAVIDEKAQTSLEEEVAYLKDKVNMVLITKNLEDVQTPEGIEKIKEELLIELNELAEDKVVDVLFPTWVSQ